MVRITALIISSVLLVFGQCDLIGYNRLGNNVHGHLLNRPAMAKGNHHLQLFRWILDSNDLSVGEKKIWLQKLALNTRPAPVNGLRERSINRLRKYTRTMASS